MKKIPLKNSTAILLSVALAIAPNLAHAADTKVSNMTNGSMVQTTDQIPAVRAGANVRVQVGSAATQPSSAFLSSTGTIPPASLPNPTSSTLGGVRSAAAVANQFVSSISTSGIPALAQPAFTNLSGNIAVSQMNGGTGASSSTAWFGDGTWKTVSGGSSVSVTSLSPALVVNPSPGTGTFTLKLSDLLNAQTGTTYTIQPGDMGKTVTQSNASSIATTLPDPVTTGFGAGAAYTNLNLGVGTNTITPGGSKTINAASNLILHKGGWAYPISDGTNYSAISFPGYGTITSGSLMKFTADTSGAATAAVAGTDYQAPITLTTTGSTGAATLIGNTLNIPNYVGGGGGGAPGGSTGQYQYNDSGNFAGAARLTNSTAGVTITSAAADALTVGLNGATNPALTVDASTALSVTGAAIKSGATGTGVTITTTDSATNSSMTVSGKGTGFNNFGGTSATPGITTFNGSTVNLQVNAIQTLQLGQAGVQALFSPVATSSARQANHILFTGPAADIGLNASTNVPSIFFNLATSTRTHLPGATAKLSEVVITGPTMAFTTSSSTVTNMGLLELGYANAGTNAVFTNNAALYIPSAAVTGTQTTVAGIISEAPTGGINNFAAIFTGNVKLDGTAPVASTCGSGTVAAGSTNHKGQITGITTATACTLTFSAPLATAPACTFSSNNAITPTINTISAAAVTMAMASLTGTVYYICF